MNLIVTIYTLVNTYEFVIDTAIGDCEYIIQSLIEAGRITFELPNTYFDNLQMIGYACSVGS